MARFLASAATALVATAGATRGTRISQAAEGPVPDTMAGASSATFNFLAIGDWGDDSPGQVMTRLMISSFWCYCDPSSCMWTPRTACSGCKPAHACPACLARRQQPMEWARSLRSWARASWWPSAITSTIATSWAHIRIWNWAESVSRPPEKHELVLSIEMGCADTVQFPRESNTLFY